MSSDKIYDHIVIGSGFGGSVSAMRLTEKGYDVLVLEKGHRYEAEDFPKTNWNFKKYLWLPKIKMFGIQRMDFFKTVAILSGVGVGGGSLVYANTHMVPPDKFFGNKAWSHLNSDWKKTLEPFYALAKRMLGSTRYSKEFPEDKVLEEIAIEMGRDKSYKPVDAVGVYFGDTENPADPYFNGLGPDRTGCTECAGCMIGCQHGAKNTLDKNYLWFAEKWGAKVEADTHVTKIELVDDVYHIHTRKSSSFWNRADKVYMSKSLVVSAGVLGTMRLLMKNKFQRRTLTDLSDKLGYNLRTNSESLCGIADAEKKINHGIAISRVFEPDDDTHIELVKYPDGSGAMGRLATLATGNAPAGVRFLKLLGNVIKRPFKTMKLLFHKNLAETSLWLLVMQNLDNAGKMVWTRGLFRNHIDFQEADENRVPAYIEIGQQVMHRYAKKVGGTAMNATTEVVLNMASTAHILGGCPMGKTIDEGVVNERFEVHGYPNMWVLDGSIIPCNLGVNPSLTITALSEYAMSLILNKEGNNRKTLKEQMHEATL